MRTNRPQVTSIRTLIRRTLTTPRNGEASGYGDWQNTWISSEFLDQLARIKAHQLVRTGRFTESDCQDLEQDIRVGLLLSRENFDSKKGTAHAFFSMVADRTAANVIRAKGAAKRSRRGTGSLNTFVAVDGQGPVELLETIGRHELDARLRGGRRTDEERSDLTMDVEEVMASLPNRLRDLAQFLMWHTVSDAARDLGVPRTTIYGWIRKIRKCFERASLRDYL